MCIYYLQIAFSPVPMLPCFNDLLSTNKFDQNIDIRILNLSDTIDLAKVWISKNLNVEVQDLFIGFLKFYAIEFEYVEENLFNILFLFVLKFCK